MEDHNQAASTKHHCTAPALAVHQQPLHHTFLNWGVHTASMPKHALAPTREKPSVDPSVCGSSSTATPVVLSNEVLLRSKIAQLQLERAKQQGKGKDDNGAAAAPTPSSPLRARGQQAVAVAAAAAAAAAVVGTTSSSSANAAHGSGRKACTATSKHRLAKPQAGQSRPQNGLAAAAAASGVKGKPGGAEGRGERGAARVESEEEVMRRFEAQVFLARREGGLQSAPRGSSENSGTPPQQQQWHGFTSQGMQALRDMYREQVQAARTMSKQADTLTRKTQEMEKLNEVYEEPKRTNPFLVLLGTDHSLLFIAPPPRGRGGKDKFGKLRQRRKKNAGTG
ncbi:unnamed protein product, partial [Ectocarpus sp. 4 AP-2014]